MSEKLQQVAIFFLIYSFSLDFVIGYDEKYDKLDVDKIIADDAQFNGYISCLLDKGPCTLEYAEDFKKILPEVLSTACAKCSDLQKKNVRKTVAAIHDKKPEEFKLFQEKYDPKGEHQVAFSKFMAETN